MTVRLKLTLLYGGLFVAAGLILITLSYGLIRLRNLDDPPRRPLVERIQERGEHEDEDDDIEDRLDRARQDERAIALRQIWRQSLFALAIMTVGAVAVGWFLAGNLLSPLRRITSHAQSASASTLDARINLEGPEDELKDLADTFDAMLDRLQAAFQAQQGFAAQASHELRTPLAIIRAEAELAQENPHLTEAGRKSIDAILLAVQRSERLVEGLLALTRSESTMREAALIDLADLAGDVVGEHVTEADGAGVHLDLSLTATTIRGDSALLRQMIANLVQNAIHYNLPGGKVNVTVRPEERAAVLIVENSGPIVDRTEIDALFEPFTRGEWARRNRPGFGLGLAIVRSIVTAHNGTIAIDPLSTGGLRVATRLPLATPLP
jgi:signal transduction histidine kinase